MQRNLFEVRIYYYVILNQETVAVKLQYNIHKTEQKLC